MSSRLFPVLIGRPVVERRSIVVSTESGICGRIGRVLFVQTGPVNYSYVS